MLFTAVTFIAFTALVAVIAWWRTRDDDLSTQDGYFLAGRSLTGPVIAGSLMLTNLSTEQLIGQTGQSFSTNMGPIAWEVTSAAALVILALVFLPRYLKMGLTTVPEFLENRYDSTTKRIVSIMFLLGYLLTYLPTVLYSGALVFNQIFEVDKRMGVSQMQGVIITAVAIGIVGACYAIFGGLKAVAVSDTINGIGLIIGGFMIPIFGLLLLGNDNFLAGLRDLISVVPAEKFNAINPAHAMAPMIPWPVLFTGMVVNNMFYWCTNQAIIQRTLGAKNLCEAQRGAIFAGFLKCCGPFFITICGLICYRMSMDPAEGFFSAEHIANLAKTSDLASCPSRCSASSQPCCSARSCRPLTRRSTLRSRCTHWIFTARCSIRRQRTHSWSASARSSAPCLPSFRSAWRRSSALPPPVCMTSSSPASASSTCRFWRRSSSVCSPEMFPLVPPRYRS